MVNRSHRQELILTLITQKPIRTQEDLIEELSRKGVAVTQSTLSRELKALGVGKAPDGRGGYCYKTEAPTGAEPVTAVAALIRSVDRAENLLVVKTPPGSASAVAEGIDRGDWDDVLGTIAGDNTILIICQDERRANKAEKRLKQLARL